MSNPTVNIIAFNTLYEILYEIKDVLKFEVKNYVNLEKFFETNKENKLAQLNEGTNMKSYGLDDGKAEVKVYVKAKKPNGPTNKPLPSNFDKYLFQRVAKQT